MDPNSSENRLIRALEEVAYELRAKRGLAGEPPWAPEHTAALLEPTVRKADVKKVAQLLQADVDYLERHGNRWGHDRVGGYRRALHLIEAWTGVEP